MIPSVIASQVRFGLEDYLRATFPVESPFFRGIFDRFFAEENQLFRGPYLSLRLPFRLGTGATAEMYPELPMKFLPYLHQEEAYRRLSAKEPKSTLIATGTGSGKTECFMYPLLHYCWQHRAERGIKAIVIYPMNALATDQMKRFAREIYNNPALKGNVTIGLFIGGQKDDFEGSQSMQEETVITCRDTMLKNPPDILMTNYKMLDYLLIRPKDYQLWKANNAETLKYVVVDELHTFDGAQGTDLACLLRRLLHRLQTPEGHICFAGTSATLGNSKDSIDKLLAFAGKLFGTSFDHEAVVAEDTLKPYEFLGDTLGKLYPVPGREQLNQLQPTSYHKAEDYLSAQIRLWFGDDCDFGDLSLDENRVALGKCLLEHNFFQNLIKLLGNGTTDENDLTAKLERILPGFGKSPISFRNAFFDSLYAMVSMARREVIRSDGKKVVVPFLNVRVQLWMREMRRMVATVEKEPVLGYGFDRKKEETVCSLPLVHCRDCGKMGYVSVRPPSGSALLSNPDEIYQAFFNHRPSTCFVFPLSEIPEGTVPGTTYFLCGHCLHLGFDGRKCFACGKEDKLIPVELKNPHSAPDKNGNIHVDNDCPYCGSVNSLTIVGARSASLTSVVISQLFASQYNEANPKLLAFSDSVQDASHRAGFFTARTYRFNLRAAIQQTVQASGSPMSLPLLARRFLSEWQQRIGTKEAFIAQFIPTDLINWEYDYLAEHGSLPEGSTLYENVMARLHWEIWSEYGYRSRIGRTLEKTGCSVAGIAPELMEQWAANVFLRVHDDLGFRECKPLQIQRLLAIFVRTLCTMGCIYADYFKAYMADGNSYELKMHHSFLPNFYKKRAPVFVGFDNIPPRFENLLSGKYQKYLLKCLGNLHGLGREVFQAILEEGIRLDILTAASAGQMKTWGLNPEKLLVTQEVRIFSCEKTGHLVSVPAWEENIWDGMPSNRTDDGSTYLPVANASSNFYAELYNYGNIQRVIAKEHTGLLEREEREQLEQNFIKGENVGNPNILSCTPTLEMGINIGDLSTVILCSVPPAQANYVQRIGRAGRRDGNAFNFVVAAGNRHHDMHFFAEPMEMMAGEVTPPGIFLQAPAVLERQLTAFCFDSWIREIKGAQDAIPPQLKVVLNTVESKDVRKFPYTFFAFVSQNRTALLNDFCAMFPEVFTNDNPHLRQDIVDFMEGKEEGGLEGRMLSRLQMQEQKRNGYRKKLKEINERLKKAKARPQDAEVRNEITELSDEKRALNGTLREMEEKLTFNYFTDEGLLPNYAFPEAGVTLRSIIYHKNLKDDETSAETKEYERSGRSAISEFAPGNVFYVAGRKLTINRIVLTDNDIEHWHFCGVCNHIELETEPRHTTSCPKCGSPTWGDGNMVRNVVRMREVIASEDDIRSRSYDEGDDREPVFFNKFMMAEFSPEYIECAYKADEQDFPFGFEYHRKAQFREINFGSFTCSDNDDINIAKRKVSRQGFRVCKDCGVVALANGKSIRHKASCKYFGKNDEQGTLECLYLFREFESEAIRVLLPIDEMEMDSKMNSFIAALYMGLKERFEGSVDHIQILLHNEPIPESSLSKTYLVLYDQIPGGTGYLKQLTSSATEFMLLLEKTLDKLKNCRCQREPRQDDGCYSCLYAYRVSHDLPNIKSSEARGVLESLMAHKDKIVKTDGIDSINVNPILESALEKQFIDGIQGFKWQGNAVELEKRIIGGKIGYVLKLGDNVYAIEPQVHLGQKDGVALDSKPDFLISNLHKSTGMTKPIAVFTDGFQYHADLHTPGCYNFPSDLAKRMAIVKSGKYLIWSLTYNDVVGLTEHSNDIPPLPCKVPAEKDPCGLLQRGAFEQLLMYLANPDEKAYSDLAFYVAATGVRPEKPARTEEVADYLRQLQTEEKSPCRFVPKASGPSVCINKTVDNEATCYSFFMTIANDDFRHGRFNEGQIVMRFSDSETEYSAEPFRKMWNSFLSTYNLMQFLPRTIVLSDRFVKEGLLIAERAHEKQAISSEWQELIQSLEGDKELYSMALEFIARGLEVPVCSYELEKDGEVTGEMAEFAWPDRRIAVVSSENDRIAFERDAWNVFMLKTENLCELLAEKITR